MVMIAHLSISISISRRQRTYGYVMRQGGSSFFSKTLKSPSLISINNTISLPDLQQKVAIFAKINNTNKESQNAPAFLNIF